MSLKFSVDKPNQSGHHKYRSFLQATVFQYDLEFFLRGSEKSKTKFNALLKIANWLVFLRMASG